MPRAPLLVSVSVLLLILSLLCTTDAAESPGLRVLSAYCVPINIWASVPGNSSVLIAESLNCGQQSQRVLFNTTSLRIEVTDADTNVSLAQFEATLSSPQSSLVVFNDTLLLAPTYVVLTDMKEDEYESLGIDTAQVRYVGVADLSNILSFAKLHLLGRSTQCFDCLAETALNSLVFIEPPLFYIDTRWQYDLFISNITGDLVTKEWRPMYQLRRLYVEHAHYTLVATPSPTPTLFIFLDRRGDNSFMPIWIGIAIFFGLSLIWAVGYKSYRRWFVPYCCDLWDWGGDLVRLKDPVKQKADAVFAQSSFSAPRHRRFRMHSLDAFRGFWLLAMIFFNYGGGGYWFFRGSPWNGLTFADLAIPMLMLAMGVAMAFTIDVYAENSRNFLPLLFKISKRTAAIYMFGLAGLLNANEKHFRYMGPLQQFALTYWLTSLILICVPRFRPGMPRVYDESLPLIDNHNDASLHSVLIGIRPYVFQWLLVVLIAIVHPLLALYLPVPGCPTGYLGPGGIGDFGLHPNCTGGAVVFVDKTILGFNHIYPFPTCRVATGLALGDGGLYNCTPLEPQGILSFCTMILLVFIGVQVGRFVRFVRSDLRTILRMLLMAVMMVAAGLGLSGASQNDGWIPVNKNLNSLSYVLISGGLGLLLLTLAHLCIDVIGLWNGAPFRYPGLNAIGLGIISEIVQFGWPFNWQPVPQHANVLVMNVTSCVIFALIAKWAFLHDDWRLVA